MRLCLKVIVEKEYFVFIFPQFGASTFQYLLSVDPW